MGNKYILQMVLFLIAITEIPAVKVSIYYESLCPDSIDFIINQLSPNYQKLKQHLQLDWVPYGKATQYKKGDSWKFTCQHKNAECNGNKYQACALNQGKGQDSDVKFINCVMSLSNPASEIGIEDCATTFNYNWDQMSTCFSGKEGSNLLAQFGDRTLNLDPPLNFVPTIIFNDKFNQTLQDQSLYDFEGAVLSLVNTS